MRGFSQRIVAWQRTCGRNDLPWQQNRDPYRIWVSEIMLQQTQVSTVIPYYERFMAAFPDVRALADASLDDVLAHWSGLGYYSRARHLHRAACMIRDDHAGRFPDRMESVVALPGVGRSTAAAILVFAYGTREAILDGNVKRVLARVCGIEGYPGDKPVTGALWHAAEKLVPREDVQSYTQGLMDLGATVCVRHSPRCGICPVKLSCVAHNTSRTSQLPAPRPRKERPHRSTTMLVLEHGDEVLLEKRPAPGIWGGLWCFPEIHPGEDPATFCMHRFGLEVRTAERLPKVEHGFTHFTLTISPVRLDVTPTRSDAREAGHQWLHKDRIDEVAKPSPVTRILALVRTGNQKHLQ
jgi:A/G-specific adenine glycosylase